MDPANTRRVTCKGCTAERSPELASTSLRPPCPECGETAILVHQPMMAESVGIVESIKASLIPEDQKRTWKRRWQDAQDHLNRLLAPHSEPMGAAAIHAAHADLQAFYVQTYHLKDSLKDASASTGISPQTVETEITNNADLALLADLANLDKHGRLSKPPRSGHSPRIVSVRGSAGSAGATPGGWSLEVAIDHRGRRLDGLDAARRALSAWEQALERWNLL